MKKFIVAVLIGTCGFDAQAQNEDSAFIRRIADEILLNSTGLSKPGNINKTNWCPAEWLAPSGKSGGALCPCTIL